MHLDAGPSEENRKCTDVLCYGFFILFIAAMAGCSIYGYAKGHPGKLLAPLDADGK